MEIAELTSENIGLYLNDCLQLQHHLVSDTATVSEAQFTATAAAPETYLLALIEDGRVLGLGTLSRMTHPVKTTGYVNNIVVAPAARGRGYFRVIMDDLEAKAKEWGCAELALTCSRPDVQGLYDKRGYVSKDTKFYHKNI